MSTKHTTVVAEMNVTICVKVLDCDPVFTGSIKCVIRNKSTCNYLHYDISIYSRSELFKEYIDNENVKRATALCK